FDATTRSDALADLDRVIHVRATSSGDTPSYTRKLLGNRNLRLKKIGEECAELVTALADADRERASEEAADVLYHVLVALRANEIRLSDVLDVLASRAR